MVETEKRKKDVAKQYIKEKILNKELVDVQGSILGELNSLKQEIESLTDFTNILGSEKPASKQKIDEQKETFGLNGVMKILFNEKGNQRTKIGYEANKLLNGIYFIISEEGRKNLDLLYESLQKSKTEQELKISLNNELSQLQDNITSNGNSGFSGNNGNEIIGNNPGGYENLSSAENKEKQQVSEQYIYKQAKLYGVTDNRQIAYILATVKGECGFKNIKEDGGENKKYGKIDSSTGKAYYGRGFLQLTHKGNYEKYTKIIRDSKLKFRDNNGNILMGDKLDLVKNPDIVLESNDLASFILIDWMKNGGPYRQDSKKLSHYINGNKMDYFNARYIINGDKNYVRNGKKAGDTYKEYAQYYLQKIGSGTTPEIQNEDNILREGYPELLT